MSESYIEYCSLIPPMEWEDDNINEYEDEEEDRYEDYLLEGDEEDV